MSSRAPWADGSGAMFDHIAARYDQLNRLISFGLDGRWRRTLCRAAVDGSRRRVEHVLDLATGTGDVAFELWRHGVERVSGVDPSDAMLRQASRKSTATAASASGRLSLIRAVGEQLPFAAETFDASVISFGIRNVSDRLATLRELERVTRSGGAVAVLELSEPRGSGLVARAARLHLHGVVPLLGAMLSRDAAYRYLPRSVARFPAPGQFAALMQQAGLEGVRTTALGLGALQLFVGRAR